MKYTAIVCFWDMTLKAQRKKGLSLICLCCVKADAINKIFEIVNEPMKILIILRAVTFIKF